MEKTTRYLGQYHSELFSCFPGSDRNLSSFIFLSYHNPNCVGPLPKNIALHIFVVQLMVMICVTGDVTFILFVPFELRPGKSSGFSSVQRRLLTIGQVSLHGESHAVTVL